MKKKKTDQQHTPQHSVYGPGDDCHCPVCVFSKSHAPGDAYDLEQCPKYRQQNKNR